MVQERRKDMSKFSRGNIYVYSSDRDSWRAILPHLDGDEIYRLPDGSIIKHVHGSRATMRATYYIVDGGELKRVRRVKRETTVIDSVGSYAVLKRVIIDLGGVRVPEEEYIVERRRINGSVMRTVYHEREIAEGVINIVRRSVESGSYIDADIYEVDNIYDHESYMFNRFINGYDEMFTFDSYLSLRVNAPPPGWGRDVMKILNRYLGAVVGEHYNFEYVKIPLWRLSIPPALSIFRRYIARYMSSSGSEVLNTVSSLAYGLGRILLPVVVHVAMRHRTNPWRIRLFALHRDGTVIYSVGRGRFRNMKIDWFERIIDI